MAVAVPDLTSRPFHLTVTRDMAASPATLFRAWTEQFDRWFAAPGTVLMAPAWTPPSFSRRISRASGTRTMADSSA
jgi:uncharacterized protein YndB with AHSA1/START domain